MSLRSAIESAYLTAVGANNRSEGQNETFPTSAEELAHAKEWLQPRRSVQVEPEIQQVGGELTQEPAM